MTLADAGPGFSDEGGFMTIRAIQGLAMLSVSLGPLGCIGGADEVDTRESALIGQTPTIRYSPDDGGILVTVELDRGLVAASALGSADFSVEVALTLVDPDGGEIGIIATGGCPKVEDPHADSLTFDVLVPWDGKALDGDDVAGEILGSYRIDLLSPGGKPMVGARQTGGFAIIASGGCPVLP
jgi:hypothetical protein